MKIIAFVLFASISIPALSDVPSIWETDKTFRAEIDGVNISVGVDRGKFRQGIRAFVFTSSQSVETNIYNNRLRTIQALLTEYRGECSRLITLTLRIPNPKVIGISGVKQNSILDYPLNNILYASVVAITKQCPELEVMRVKYQPPSYASEGGHSIVTPPPYFGTMRSANNWKLEKGLPKTSIDSHHRFKISFRDFYGIGGINFEGSCESEPYLVLDPQHRFNDYEKKIPDMYSAPGCQTLRRRMS